MKQKLNILLQYLVPQHALSRFAGWIAECRWHWLKNWLIKDFISRYNVDLQLAVFSKIEDYSSFNHFFTRLLKPELRPIIQEKNQIASPVDGNISQIGIIEQDTLFQAKGFYFNLTSLLGDNSANHTKLFLNGYYATLYLAPKDYHRVHMPLTGNLRETIYIPGKLFSVNQNTALHIPQLFTRNERLVCLFDTAAGSMAVILVGAMLVSSIKTVWPTTFNTKKITSTLYHNTITLEKGAELGHFKMGSTVILLFSATAIKWAENMQKNSNLQMGQSIGLVP